MIRFLLLTGALALAGCATTRPDTFWYADTLPQGAIITTNIGLTCVTPCRLEIPRWDSNVRGFTYRIEMAGYEAVEGAAVVQVNDTLAAGAVVAVALTLAGSPILPGPLDDNGYIEIEPNPLRVELQPSGEP